MKTWNSIFWLTLLFAVIPWKALADDAVTLRMGADFTHYKNETAIYSLGSESFDRDGFGCKLEGGFWTAIDPSHRASPFGSVLGGKRFGDYNGFNLTGFFGVVVLGHTDGALGGNAAFTEEAVLGYKTVSLGYKHISNAGLFPPNHGRDYISLTLAFPL